jgi:uncharacterized repeat protein (TIGR03803 family)
LFDFNVVNGQFPYSTLTFSGKKLFGATSGGGANNFGCIYSIDTNGNNYRILYNFDSIHGGSPYLDLTLSGNELYGSTQIGAANGNGCIFSIDTNGTRYKDIYDYTLEGYTEGSLLYSAGSLYGVIPNWGANYAGYIFSIDTNGSRFRDLFDFDTTDGEGPFGALARSGALLYGTTIGGGVNDSGCIFSIDTNGSNYSKLYDFDWLNGSEPIGSLLFSGGVLYGMTYWGGTGSGNVGVVFGSRVCSNTYNEPICITTIDTSNNKCEVIWGRTNSPSAGGYGYYSVYKDSTSGYELTHTQPLDSLSEYVDLNSDPTLGPVSYELSTVDSCGESALSAPHTTIFLTTTSGINAFILNWTPYLGFTPSKYRIFRGPALNTMVQIDSVPNTTLTFTDSFPPLGSFYGVEAVSPFGVCVPTSHRPNHSPSLSGSFSNGFNTATLGIQNLSSTVSKLNIYPNPSNGVFSLSYSLNTGGTVHITILNELGQIVYNNTEQRNAGSITEQLNLESLAAGIYSLRMQTDNGITVRKIAIVGKN